MIARKFRPSAGSLFMLLINDLLKEVGEGRGRLCAEHVLFVHDEVGNARHLVVAVVMLAHLYDFLLGGLGRFVVQELL